MPDDVVLPRGTGDPLHVVGDGVGGREEGAGVAVQLAAGGRQADPSAVTREKRYPELFFELTDGAAERLLTEVQPVRGPREAAGVGDCQEVLQPP